MSNNATHSASSTPPPGGNAFTAWIGSTLMRISGWELEGELPQHPKMVLAVGPHTSNWDFFLGIAVLFRLRISIKFLGKHTIFVPVVKQLLEALGGIPVDRKAGNGVVQQVVARFNSKPKMILALAPEGTRSPVYPWKTGFLSIAHQAHAPVVLIGFDFARKRVIFGPTIVTTDNHQADMRLVYEFFQRVPAKYPTKVLFDAK
ncbi:MAG: 1-acyl-sn-glycerol-3-phosphate acyltransferase [Glaciecola sp.]